VTLVILAQFIDWRRLLTIVQPDTLICWRRHAFRLVWRWRRVLAVDRGYRATCSS
jgi:hypothetical protein